MKTEGALNPFVVAPGEDPPCLAGREDVEAWLREDVERMGQGGRPRNEILLYAPRGHGKTVLLCEDGLGKVATEHKESL